jgi:lipopolysaccharide export system protein LptA
MILFRTFLFFCLVYCFEAKALIADDNQAILIESDAAERNEKTGLTQYIGNVSIRQGTLTINASTVELFYQGNRVSRILSTGNPASYQQNNLSEQILASAEIIEFLPKSKKIQLKTNASLSKDGTLITGDSIYYDIANETWRAKGDNQSSQKRIQLVIPPLEKTDKPSQVKMTVKENTEESK